MKRIGIIWWSLLCCLVQVQGQNYGFWSTFPGPSGGQFQNITRTQNGGLYISFPADQVVPAFLYRSVDEGENWTKIPMLRNGQPLRNFVGVTRSGALYTLVPDSASVTMSLYRSDDEGANWAFLQDSLPFNEVFETPGGALLARTALTRDIWRSTDGGTHWQVEYSLSSDFFRSFTLLQNGDVTCIGNNDEVYRSQDNGLNWQLIPSQGSTYYAPFVSSSGAILLFCVEKTYRSDDNGQTWAVIMTGGNTLDFVVELQDGSLLGATGDSRLFQSADDGQTWTPVQADHQIHVLQPFRLSNGQILGTGNTIYRSGNGGQSWQFAGQGTDPGNILSMAFIGEDSIFAMTFNGLWRTFNAGQHWDKLTDSPDLNSTTFKLGQSGRLVVAVGDSLYWSEDYGDHLSNITPPQGFSRGALELSPNDSFLFVNGPGMDILRSADKGQSWEHLTGYSAGFAWMVFHPSGRIFARRGVNQGYGLWFSDDHGSTWLSVGGLPDTLSVNDLYVDYQNIIYLSASTFAFPFVYHHIYRSTDNGVSWLLLPDPQIYQEEYFLGNSLGHLFLSSKFRSIDHGQSWHEIPHPGDAYAVIRGGMSPAGYLYGELEPGFCRTTNPTTFGSYLDGHLRRDADADCSTPDAQTPLQDWVVQATGPDSFWTTTDTLGHFLMFLDTGAYTVQARTPNPLWWNICEGAQNVQVDNLLNIDSIHFSAAALSECPLMTVDLAIPQLRRCFDNTLYLRYCNQGAETADSATVEITLDPFVTFVSATLPAEDLGNHLYRFQIGNIESGQCGQFTLVVHVDCDSTVVGQTHCFSAHAYPDTLCAPTPDWSGATIQARIECQDSLLELRLKNIGTAPSHQLDYIIIVDDVVLMKGSQTYTPEQEITLNEPANGHTWRIESQQEPGYPFATDDHIALAFAEGCGGYNSLGYINQFPVDELSPFADRECVENVGSFDPNDKQGFPTGTGAEHQIRPGQDLEYLIRFQNTGTDTAFTVVVRDTLSPWLDPASVRPGASSHPYTWALGNGGILSFTFSNILLPDSNKNEAASHGFISFRIAQQADVPLGAVVYNKADIYFDYNAPVTTNQTWHTIGVPPTVGLLPAPENPLPTAILVSPQPASDFAVFQQGSRQPFRNHRLYLSDALGHVVRQTVLNGGQCRIERNELPAGLYFFRVETPDGRPAGSGRLLWQE